MSKQLWKNRMVTADATDAASTPAASTPAGAPPSAPPPRAVTSRYGFESSAGCALHYETVRELATALSSGPRLHTWASVESERMHAMPDAFREVWAQSTPSSAQTLQARLRQKMRLITHCH